MKILSVGAELFYADRRTDMTKLLVTFRNFFSKGPKKKTTAIVLSQTKQYYFACESHKKTAYFHTQY